MGRMAWAGGQGAEPRGQRKDQERGPALALVSSWACLLPAHTVHLWCLFPLLSCCLDAHLAEKHLLGMKVNLEPQYIKQLVRALLRGAASEGLLAQPPARPARRPCPPAEWTALPTPAAVWQPSPHPLSLGPEPGCQPHRGCGRSCLWVWGGRSRDRVWGLRRVPPEGSAPAGGHLPTQHRRAAPDAAGGPLECRPSSHNHFSILSAPEQPARLNA